MDDTRTDPTDEVLASSPEGLREQALRSVKKRRDLKTHAFAYAVFNLLVWALWIIAAATSDSWGFPWPLFMTLGWGVGLAFNAWDVHFRRPITEAELQREAERLRHLQSS